MAPAPATRRSAGLGPRVTALVSTMIAVAVAVGGTAVLLLNRTGFEQVRTRLVETAQSRARMIEAVARYDRTQLREDPAAARAATLSQVRDAHSKFKGLGRTGEFVLAERQGDEIVFLVRHRYDRVDKPDPIPIRSKQAEPMRRALTGASGSMVGRDYRGVIVLAAYESLGPLGMGIVAKIDLAEVRAPFLKATAAVTLIAILVIAGGTLLFFRLSEPIVRRVVDSENHYRALVEGQSDLICQCRDDGTLLFVNAAFRRFFGRAGEKLVGRNLRDLLPERFRPSALDALASLTPEDPVATYEASVDRGDGELRWLQWTDTAFFDESGHAVEYLAAGRDVTDQKRAAAKIEQINLALEERVKQRTVALEAAKNELEAFAYAAAHDLRAPLRAIEGFSLALVEDYVEALDENALTYLRYVREGTEEMAAMIDALLALSQVSHGELATECVDLSRVVSEIARELAEEEPGRDVVFDIAPGVIVEGDPRLLRVAMRNLLENAWKFTRDAAPARIAFAAEAANGKIRCRVSDNGVGFDAAHADALFDPFRRLHAAADFPGSGIGLSTVRRIIERHGGRVWAEGGPGEGAIFRFELQRGGPDGRSSGAHG